MGITSRMERAEGRFDTGRILENSYFGEVGISDAMRDELNELSSHGYVSSEKLFDLVRRHTKEDPTNPRKDVARELRLAVMESLDVDGDEVKLYSAVDTPVDVMLGTDAWVEYADPKTGEAIIVTLDITKRADKIESGHKADIVFGELPAIFEEGDRYLEEIGILGEKIAMKIREKRDEIEEKRYGRSA